jgi:hypothetical protein
VPAAQDRLLDLAERQGWSRARLREEATRVRPAPTAAATRTVTVQVETRDFLVRLPDRTKWPAVSPVHGSPISLTAIGSHGEAAALRTALAELRAWEGRHCSLLDAPNAGILRQLREGLERQLTGVPVGASGTPEPSRRLN